MMSVTSCSRCCIASANAPAFVHVRITMYMVDLRSRLPSTATIDVGGDRAPAHPAPRRGGRQCAAYTNDCPHLSREPAGPRRQRPPGHGDLARLPVGPHIAGVDRPA